MRYYIADLHFCHDNLNQRMDRRGFESGEAMNEYMIRQWNSRVRHRDEVIILGDFCLSRDVAEVNALLGRLSGKKYLIIGNHDRYLENKLFDRSVFQWIENYKELNDNKRKVILSHYGDSALEAGIYTGIEEFCKRFDVDDELKKKAGVPYIDGRI